MKILKYALYTFGGLIALLIVAALAAVMVVDGGFVKSRLERAMKEKNRTLSIEGEPRLRLFPVAGIALGKSSLSEPGSDKVFVSLESMEAAVRVMPLLTGEVAVESLKLAGLTANLVRGKDGRMNFADLAEGGAKSADETPQKKDESPRVRIAEMSIERVRVNFRDEASGREVAVSDLVLKSARLDGDAPGPVSFAMRVTGKKPELDVAAQAAGALRFNLPRQEYGIDGFSLKAKGRMDRDTLNVELSAPRLEITPSKAGGSAIDALVQIRGPQRNVEAKLRIDALEGSASALAIPALALTLDASVDGNALKGRITTPFKANLVQSIYELPKIAADLTIASPAIPQKTVTLPIEGSLRADLAKQNVAAQIATRFDESRIQAKLGATRLEPLEANFDLAIDRINLDRYLPAEKKEAKSDDRIDLGALKGKTVSGKIAIDALTVKRVRLESLKAEVKLGGGKLEVAPHSANLYGGTLTGALAADANGNRIQIREAVHNVGIGVLLRDALQKDILEGRGNLALDAQASGATFSALKKALAGSARIEMKDGAIKGINLADSVRNARAALGAKQAKADPSQKTDFSAMSASFKIANGVAHNEDLKAVSPFIRLGGAGDLDIGNNTIDYLAKAALVATSKGQGGREAGNVAGITVPVKLTGPLDSPNWNIDYSAMLGALGGAAGAVTEIGRKGVGGVRDAVRGLFKR